MDITLEQELTYYSLINKWHSIITSTAPIDQSKALDAIYSAYKVANLPVPEIHFVSSPLAQKTKLKELAISAQSRELISPNILVALCDLLLKVKGRVADLTENHSSLSHYIWTKYEEIRSLVNAIETKLAWRSATYYDELILSFPEVSSGITYLEGEFIQCAWLEFAVNVLQWKYPSEAVKAYHGLIETCGLTRQLRNILVVCDRPTKLHLDAPLLVEFSDGFTA